VIDYQQTDFSQTGDRYDVIIDTVGNISLDQFRRTTPATGQLLAVNAGGGMMLRALMPMLGGRRIIVGVATERLEDLQYVRELALTGVLRATIHSRVPFAEIVRAHAIVDSGRKHGAVVVDVSTAPAG
jgi:NADPH:quinone reductase-like Zn-dependent oxidoreductase